MHSKKIFCARIETVTKVVRNFRKFTDSNLNFVITQRTFVATNRDFVAINRNFVAINLGFVAIARTVVAVDPELVPVGSNVVPVDLRVLAIDVRVAAIDLRVVPVDSDFVTIDRKVVAHHLGRAAITSAASKTRGVASLSAVFCSCRLSGRRLRSGWDDLTRFFRRKPPPGCRNPVAGDSEWTSGSRNPVARRRDSSSCERLRPDFGRARLPDLRVRLSVLSVHQSRHRDRTPGRPARRTRRHFRFGFTEIVATALGAAPEGTSERGEETGLCSSSFMLWDIGPGSERRVLQCPEELHPAR